MTLQMRPMDRETGVAVGVKYAPARDVVYLYPDVIKGVEQRLYDAPFKPLHAWLAKEGVTEADIAETVRCYCLFLNAAHKDPDQSVEQCMEACGWFKCPAPARTAMMFYIGASMTGTFFKGIRDITPLGDDTTPEVLKLMQVADRVSQYASLGTMGRWWVRFKTKWLTRKRYHTDRLPGS